MADPKVIYENGKYYAVAPSMDWSGWMGTTDESKLWPDATGSTTEDLKTWVARNMGKVASKMTTKQGFAAVELKGLGNYKGPTTGGPDPGEGTGRTSSVEFNNYADAQAYGNRIYGVGTENTRWWVSLGDKGKPVVEPIQPGKPKPASSKRIIGSQNMPGTNMVRFQYADGDWSNPIQRAEAPESPADRLREGVGAPSYSEAVRQAMLRGLATISTEDGKPQLSPGYVIDFDDDPSSPSYQRWIVRTVSGMNAAELARARRMAEDELATVQTQSELSRMLSVMESDKPFGGVIGEAEPIYGADGSIIQYAIQEYDSEGNLTTKYVKPPEQPAPTVMAPPDPAAQVVSTDQGMYQYADNEWSPLGMSEKPATLEMQGGMMWMRDTSGNLSPVNDVLERMIEQKIIEGDWDAALQWDDFRNRPSPQEHLQAMLDYARTPADQMLLSAIARGYEQGAVPPNAGELGRVGPVPAEQRQAWERYQRSITGTGSEMSEMQEFLVQESEARNELEKERIAQDDERWQGLSDTITAVQEDSQAQMTAIQDSIATTFNSIADSVIGEAMGMEKLPISSSAETSTSLDGSVADAQPGSSVTAQLSSNIAEKGTGTLTPQEDVGTIDRDVKLLEIVSNMAKTGEWQSIDTVAQKQWWMSKLTLMSTGHASDVVTRKQVIDAIREMGSDPGSYDAHNPLAMQEFMRDWNRGDLTDPDHFWQTFQPGVDKPMGPTPEECQVQEEARLLDISDPMVMGYQLGEDGTPVQTGFMRTSELEADEDTFTGSGIREHVEALKTPAATPLTAAQQIQKIQSDEAKKVAVGGEDFVSNPFGGGERPVVQETDVFGRRTRPTPSTVTPLPLAGEPEATPPPGVGEYKTMRAPELPGENLLTFGSASTVAPSTQRRSLGAVLAKRPEEFGLGEELGRARASYAGVSADNPDIWDWEGAEGGIVHGPTVALLGEKEPEIVIPLSKLPKMAEGGIVFSSAEQQPVGIQELLAGRSPRPLGGRLLNQAGMTLPSAQSWRNLSSDEQEIYSDLGARAGITPGYMQSELESARPSGGRGAGQATMLPLATRRIFR